MGERNTKPNQLLHSLLFSLWTVCCRHASDTDSFACCTDCCNCHIFSSLCSVESRVSHLVPLCSPRKLCVCHSFERLLQYRKLHILCPPPARFTSPVQTCCQPCTLCRMLWLVPGPAHCKIGPCASFINHGSQCISSTQQPQLMML